MNPRQSAFFLTVFTVLFVAMAGVCPRLPGQEEEESAKTKTIFRALLVTGGCCHDFDLQKKILTAGIGERVDFEIDWTVVHEGGTSSYVAIPLYSKNDWAKGYDIVVHNECFTNVKNAAFVDKILKPHKEGIPAVLIHSTMLSYPLDDSRWFDFCGVVSKKSGEQHPFRVEAVSGQEEHPVMDGFLPWETPDGELFEIEKVLPTATVLTQAESKDSGEMQVNSWVNLYGEKETRVFGTTIGHHNETMRSPAYLDMLARGFLWALNSGERTAILPVEEGESLQGLQLEEADSRALKLGSNLATNRSTNASSSDGENAPGLAVDGKSGKGWKPKGTAPSWWEVDLDQTKDVGAVAILWGRIVSGREYRIEASENGREWNTLVRMEGENAGAKVSLHELDARSVRFLRIDMGARQEGFLEFAAYDSRDRVPSHVRSMAKSGEAIRESNGRSVTVESVLKPAGLAGAAGALRIQKGYAAEVFSEFPEVRGIVGICSTIEGELFVSQKDGRVLRFSGAVGDWLTGLDSPSGMAWDGEALFLADAGRLLATRDHDGDGRAESQEVLVWGFEDGAKGVTLGMDGWLHLSIPFGEPVALKGADQSILKMAGGGVVRVRRDGSGLHLLSEGIQNVEGVAVSPMLNVLARDSADPDLGWDAQLHHLTGFSRHGYPDLFKKFEEDVTEPLAEYGGGKSAGALWLAESGFSASEKSSLFSADRRRGRIYRHELGRGEEGIEENFQEVWAQLKEPAGMAAIATEGIYLASGHEGSDYIARVFPEKWESPEIPKLGGAGGEELLALLRSESHTVRLAAQMEILRQKRPPVDGLRELALSKDGSWEVRTAALFTMAQIPGLKSFVTILELAKSDSGQMRAMAFRALGDLPVAQNHEIFEFLETERNPEVIREILIAIGRTESVAGHLLIEAIKNVDHPDSRVSHTAVRMLTALDASHVCFYVLDNTEYEDLWPGAMQVLSFMPREEVVQGLVDRLIETRMAGVRIHGLKALARLYYRRSETTPITMEKWEGTPVIEELLRKAVDDPSVNKAVLLAELRRNRIEMLEVERLVSLAKKQPAIEPMVVDELSERKSLSQAAVSFLKEIALSSIRDGNMRMAAATALARSPDPEGVDVAMKVVSAADGVDISKEARAVLEDELLQSPAMAKRIDSLIRTANGGSREPGRAAWATLFSLHSRDDIDPTLRKKIEAAVSGIDRNGENQQVRLMNMIGEKGFLYGKAMVSVLKEESESEAIKVAAREASGLLANAVKRKNVETVGQMEPEVMKNQVLKSAGDPLKGKRVFTRLGCAECHTVFDSQKERGPFLGRSGDSLQREEWMEMILSPDTTISEGFGTRVFQMNDGREITGFVSSREEGRFDVRDSAGNVLEIEESGVANESMLGISMMPPGLVDSLTVNEFASLLSWLESLGHEAE